MRGGRTVGVVRRISAYRRVGACPTRRGSGHSRWLAVAISAGCLWATREAVEHRSPVQAGHPARVGPTGAPMTETPATQSGAASPYVSADTGHVLLLQRAINDLDDGEELTGGRRVDSCWASTSRRARRRPSAPSASERGMRRGTYAPSTAKSLFLSGETEGHLSLLPPALAQAHQRPTPRRSSRPPPGA
jgi:hypothetical protein